MTAKYQRKPAVDSLISFTNSQGLMSKGTLLSIQNDVVVFEVYNPYSIVQTSEVLTAFSIKKDSTLLYQGKAVVTRLVNTGLMLIVSAHLQEDWLGQLESLDLPSSDIAQFLEAWKTHGDLLPNFRAVVEEIRSFLFEFSRWLNVSQLTGTAHNNIDNLNHIADAMGPKLIELVQKFEQEAEHIPEENAFIHRTFVQHNLHPLLLSAPFVHRTYTKPLGYAGDYEMINMILRNTFEGDNDYAKIVHKLNILPPTPVSVRYRNDIMLDYVQQGAAQAAQRQQAFKVLSIACGPAVEIQRFIQQQAAQPHTIPIHIELLDFSQHTLNETQAKISALLAQTQVKHITVQYVCESVYALLKNPDQTQQQRSQYDLVYSGGLFDYLSDRVCGRLLKLFYKWLKPGGKIFTTNMHKSDPIRFWMAYVLEWFLLYRNEAEMLAWVKGLGRQRVFADPTGINLFLEIEKRA